MTPGPHVTDATPTFPDATAIDLGALEYPYGAIVLQVPHQQQPEKYRSLVLWDSTFKRMYGFAQLSKHS